MALVAVGCVLVSAPAGAAVYRCEVHGKTVFTDVPCAAGASTTPLPALGSVPAGPAQQDMVERFDRQRAAAARARKQSDAAWLKAYNAQHEREKAVRKAFVEGRVVPGMTPAQVKSVLGPPTRRSGSDSTSQRWIYINGRARKTVDFDTGVVARVRSRAGSRSRKR